MEGCRGKDYTQLKQSFTGKYLFGVNQTTRVTRQGSERIRQWTTPMILNKITQLYLLKSLKTNCFDPTNKNTIEITTIFESTKKKTWL